MVTPEETPEQREERLQRILRQVEERLRSLLPNPYQPLEKTEEEVYQIGEQLREIIERETLIPPTQEVCAERVGCRCGASARYLGHRSRQIVTRNGVQVFARAYYHCSACKQGFCPADGLLALGQGQCSVGVVALAARFASYLPYRKAAQELELVCGIRLSASTLKRQAQAVGGVLQQEWGEQEERLWAQRAEEPRKRPTQLHISMDGVLIFVDKEWKEVKLGAVYQRGKTGGVQSIRYYATLAPSVAFGKRLRTLAYQEGVDYCRKVGVVADGGEWIWQETGKHFTRSVQILDFYHVSDNLWDVAHAWHQEGSEAAKTWMQQQTQRLLNDKVGEVIAEVGRWQPSIQTHADLQRRRLDYLRTHAHRMRYATFRKRGYHIGSGVIEAGCKNVVQMRMKRAGTRWSAKGAEPMLHLCAAWCSNQPTDFRPAARRAFTPELS